MTKYIYTGGEGDVWDNQGKIVLSPSITQAELKRLHEIKHPSALAVEQADIVKKK